MPERMIFHDDTREYESELVAYWARKSPRIHRLLKRFPERHRHLRINFWHHAPRWDVRLVLSLPTATLVGEAEVEGKGYPPAIDEAVDRLCERIRRHKGSLQHDDKARRRQRQREDLAALAPHLAASRGKQRQAAFLDLLRPSLRTLRDQMRHELIVAQLDGRLHPGELTVSDVLDEAALEAWRRFDERPEADPLDHWLLELAYEALGRLIEQARPAASIDQELPEEDPRYQAEVGHLADNNPFWEESSPLMLADVLPDEETPESWQELSWQQEQNRIMDMLRELPESHRRAFSLHALDGWEDHEIAALLDCGVEEAQRMIEEARGQLRRMLQRDGTPVSRQT